MSIQIESEKFHVRVVLKLFSEKGKMLQRLAETFAICMDTMDGWFDIFIDRNKLVIYNQTGPARTTEGSVQLGSMVTRN